MHSHAVGISGAIRRHAWIVAHENDEISQRSDHRSPRRRSIVDRSRGDRHGRVESAVGGEVLDLDVHEHPVAAGIEHVVERRTATPRRDVDPPGAGSWRTSSRPDAVQPHVELDAVGALLIGEAERLGRVLGGVA